MEKLKKKREKFIKSLHALDRSITVSLRDDFSEDIMHSLVASNIKHFEMCYESAWKFLQIYLVEKYTQEQINSPKPIFRECFSLGILDNATIKELLDISEARNATVHDYDEETAQETCNRIHQYYETLKGLEKLSL